MSRMKDYLHDLADAVGTPDDIFDTDDGMEYLAGVAYQHQRENEALLITLKNRVLAKTPSETLREIREACDCADDGEADALVRGGESRMSS